MLPMNPAGVIIGGLPISLRIGTENNNAVG